MKKIYILLMLANLLLINCSAFASERSDSIVVADTTERLENIQELKANIKSMKLRLQSFEIAIAEAKKRPASIRSKYVYVKKFAEVVTTISLLVVTVAAYRGSELSPSKFMKPASVVASISSTISGVTGMLADLSDNELEILTNKIKELRLELAATEINLKRESVLLCTQEPSNQMCLNFVHK